MPLVLNVTARRSTSAQMFFANWSNRRNRSPARNPTMVSVASSPWRAWISSLTFQAARRTLSTAWRNSCSVAASGAGSNWNRCTSRLSSDVKRLVSADKVDGTVLMSDIHLVSTNCSLELAALVGGESDASNANDVSPSTAEIAVIGKLLAADLRRSKPLTTEHTKEHRGRAKSQPILGFSQCLRVSVVNGPALLQ